MRKMPVQVLFTFLLLTIIQPTQAETTLAAVASNFTKPMEEIASAFAKETGHTANLSFGSTGKFISQIENGAPFEVLVSADEKGPKKLVEAKLAVTDTEFTYALGKLVLWSAQANYVDAEGKVLTEGSYKHLALADPKLAPYGLAAIEVLSALKIQDKVKPLLVQGENIAQTFQFISTGNAELGFIALSQVIADGKIGNGSGWIVPSSLYAAIKQDAVLLTKGAENPAAKALLDYLKTPTAVAIIKKYGYELP